MTQVSNQRKKKMLIIGMEMPNIKSILWEDITLDVINEITDYQILLIDFEEFTSVNNDVLLKRNIEKLIERNHTVLFFLPRKPSNLSFKYFLPGSFNIEQRKGDTLSFIDCDSLTNILEKYIHTHEYVVTSANVQINAKSVKVYYFLTNNIDEYCGLAFEESYIVHSPEKHLYKKAINDIIDYYDPVLLQENFIRPDWIDDVELDYLELRAINEEISNIESHIIQLKEKKQLCEDTKSQRTKWSDLLFTNGTTLELRLLEAFEFLGVKDIEHEPLGSYGPDLVIEQDGLGITIEVEGSKGSIKLVKARQLFHWLADVPIHHHGVLIGNPYQDLHPDERPPTNMDLFVKEARDFAEKYNFTLITTYDIFKLISMKIKGKPVDIAVILDNICKSNGYCNLVESTNEPDIDTCKK